MANCNNVLQTRWANEFRYVLMQDRIIKIISRFDSEFELNIWLDIDDYFLHYSYIIS